MRVQKEHCPKLEPCHNNQVVPRRRLAGANSSFLHGVTPLSLVCYTGRAHTVQTRIRRCGLDDKCCRIVQQTVGAAHSITRDARARASQGNKLSNRHGNPQ